MSNELLYSLLIIAILPALLAMLGSWGQRQAKLAARARQGWRWGMLILVTALGMELSGFSQAVSAYWAQSATKVSAHDPTQLKPNELRQSAPNNTNPTGSDTESLSHDDKVHAPSLAEESDLTATPAEMVPLGAAEASEVELLPPDFEYTYLAVEETWASSPEAHNYAVPFEYVEAFEDASLQSQENLGPEQSYVVPRIDQPDINGERAAAMAPPTDELQTGVQNAPLAIQKFDLIAPYGDVGILLAWLGGTILLACRFLLRRIRTIMFHVKHTEPADAALTEQLQNCTVSRFRARLVESSAIASPMAYGVFRPTIAIPDRCRTWTQQEQQAMLVHELAHLRSRDPFWQLLFDGFASLLWWNPAAWFVRRQHSRACEQAADEASLELRDGPHALAAALIRCGRYMTGRPAVAGISLRNPRSRKSDIHLRIARLLDLADGGPPERHGRRRAAVHVTMLTAVILILLCGAATFVRPFSPTSSPHGETDMSTWKQYWKHSLAASALMFLTGEPLVADESQTVDTAVAAEFKHVGEVPADDYAISPSDETTDILDVTRTVDSNDEPRKQRIRIERIREQQKNVAVRPRSAAPVQTRTMTAYAPSVQQIDQAIASLEQRKMKLDQVRQDMFQAIQEFASSAQDDDSLEHEVLVEEEENLQATLKSLEEEKRNILKEILALQRKKVEFELNGPRYASVGVHSYSLPAKRATPVESSLATARQPAGKGKAQTLQRVTEFLRRRGAENLAEELVREFNSDVREVDVRRRINSAQPKRRTYATPARPQITTADSALKNFDVEIRKYEDSSHGGNVRQEMESLRREVRVMQDQMKEIAHLLQDLRQERKSRFWADVVEVEEEELHEEQGHDHDDLNDHEDEDDPLEAEVDDGNSESNY